MPTKRRIQVRTKRLSDGTLLRVHLYNSKKRKPKARVSRGKAK